VSKKKHLPDFDPFVGEGDPSPMPIDGTHAPLYASEATASEAKVVTEYKLENILPDFFQSRGGVLPRHITARLGEGEIDQRKALADWRKLTTKDEAQKNRYDELVRLKESIRQNGLINPVHITRAADGNGFILLCGERRYWAHWLLNEELEGYDRIPSILHADALRFLQIAENEDVEPLSTVSRARQTALAYLELLEIRPPSNTTASDSKYWDFFRQALLPTEELLGTKYRPRGLWKDLGERLGLQRRSITQLLNILRLPDEGLELADLWNVGLRNLDVIVKAKEAFQQELIEATIALQLSIADLTEIVKMANEYGEDEYRRALEYFQKEKMLIKPSGRKKRIQRPPDERFSVKIMQLAEGVSKYSKGDYSKIARLIVGNKPEEAEEYAKTLGAIARAVRAELKGK
jgi:ParB-like chromosome segregation protein Spo0J